MHKVENNSLKSSYGIDMFTYYTPDSGIFKWEKTSIKINTNTINKIRELALRISEINIIEQRGIVREDIDFKSKKDNKRGVIYRLKQRGIIRPLPDRSKRLKQYVLSNLYNEFASPNHNADHNNNTSNNNNNQEFDYGLIDRIAEYFSRENPGLHNIHLQTSTSAENYNLLENWSCNDSNRGKTKGLG